MFEIKWKGTFDCSHCGSDKPCDITMGIEVEGDYGEINIAETIRVDCSHCGYSAPIRLSRADKQ